MVKIFLEENRDGFFVVKKTISGSVGRNRVYTVVVVVALVVFAVLWGLLPVFFPWLPYSLIVSFTPAVTLPWLVKFFMENDGLKKFFNANVDVKIEKFLLTRGNRTFQSRLAEFFEQCDRSTFFDSVKNVALVWPEVVPAWLELVVDYGFFEVSKPAKVL